jgi:hypothetical protein
VSKYKLSKWVCDGWGIDCPNLLNNDNCIWFGEICLCKGCFQLAAECFQQALDNLNEKGKTQ